MNTVFDYSKLNGRITEKFGSQRAFAKVYGISENAMSRKLKGKMAITKEDILKMSAPEFLDIEPKDYHEYFFAMKVQAN